MVFILAIAIIAAGALTAAAIDKAFIQPKKKLVQLEGPGLIEALNKSETYENLRLHQKYHHSRSDNRISGNSGDVAISGDRRDGGKILQLNRSGDV